MQKTRGLLEDANVPNLDAVRKENIDLVEENKFLESQNESLRQWLEEALQEKEFLENELKSLEEHDQAEYDFRTGANGHPYSDAFCHCVWELLRLNVAEHNNFTATIRLVLKLVGKKRTNQPASNTISELSKGCLSASQRQHEVIFWAKQGQ